MRILAATLLTAVVLTLGGGVAGAIPAEAAASVAANGDLVIYNWNSSAAIVYCHGLYAPA